VSEEVSPSQLVAEGLALFQQRRCQETFEVLDQALALDTKNAAA
jgi:hypothetical protein